MTSDTRSRKITANTIAMENNRSRTRFQNRVGLGLTSQIVLRESCSSAKTPDAVNTSKTKLMRTATFPASAWPAALIMS